MKKILGVILIFIAFIFGCTGNVKTENPINTQSSVILPLSAEEFKIYQNYSKSKDDQVIKDLSPVDVCKLYFYSLEQGDMGTQYALYIKEEKYMEGSYEQFVIYARSDMSNFENTKKLLKRIKEDTKLIKERDRRDNESFVEIVSKSGKESMIFRLIKNNQGIWKVVWLPLQ